MSIKYTNATIDRSIPLQQEMQGSAEVVTKIISLFQRMISPLKSVLKSSM